jgi:DNA mismatch repair protein MutS2
VRADARAAVDRVVGRLRKGAAGARGASEDLAAPSTPHALPAAPALLTPGVRVAVGAMGLEGTLMEMHGKHAEIDVRGKRLRAALRDLRVIGAAPSAARVSVSVDLQPREGLLAELNVIGCTVDEAIARTEKFLDESTIADRLTLRIIHGHGTGQLRRGLAAFLKEHPLVAKIEAAPMDQGGAGVTVVELKD